MTLQSFIFLVVVQKYGIKEVKMFLVAMNIVKDFTMNSIIMRRKQIIMIKFIILISNKEYILK